MKKVTILYRFLPHYRIEFYNLLKEYLKNKDIELELIYGKSIGQDKFKKDEVDISWAMYKKNKSYFLFGNEIIWQPVLNNIKDSDLIIVEQANKLLLNYYLMLLRKIMNKKLAFWGHGLNLQDNPQSILNKFKRIYSNQCDWWFAYTESVKSILEKNKFPSDKITVVQNAIDTKKIRKIYTDISYEQISNIKKTENIQDGPIGIYCGGMYKEKELDFLINSIKIVKNKIPDFQMIFIGAGIEDYKVRGASRKYDWVHYVGPKFNYEKVVYLKMADLFLMPGLVGLGILDAITTETPLITTNYQFHSPEIDYLINNKNGIMTNFNEKDYAEKIIKILKNKKLINNLKSNCKSSFSKYTVENMALNFSDGIIKCLEST